MSGGAGLISRFLGPDAAAGGLHALLDLPPDSVSTDAVIIALERRLNAVDQHPQGRTPEADEVRLALHAAAAQLLDRSARAEARAGASQPLPRHAMKRQLEHDAIITLARYGGWNRGSLRRLAMLAVARGANPGDVAGVLRHLARRRGGGVGLGAPGRASAAAPRLFGDEPVSTALAQPPGVASGEGAKSRIPLVIGAVATGLTLVVAVALIVIALSSGEQQPSESEEVARARQERRPPAEDLPMQGGEQVFPWQGDGERAGAAEAAGPDTPAFENLAEALHALDSAAEGLAVDPREAAALFARAFGTVGERWCNLTIGQQRAAQHDVVEFVYRAVARPELSEQIIAAVAAGGEMLAGEPVVSADEVWPAAWSVGMLARLAREQDLGAVASRSVEHHLRRQIGSAVAVSGGFEQGVEAALWSMLPGMVAPETSGGDAEERWDRWIAAARFGKEDAQKNVLAALEWMMVAPEEPTESEPVRRALEELTLGCDWGEQSAGRPWLVRMFTDARVSNADLHAVTTTLARRSRAPGVDPTMALAIRSDAESRDLLRERYAGAWGIAIDGPTLDELAADWTRAVAEAAEKAASASTMTERLAAAVCYSRLSEAARLRYAGRLDDAGIVIDEFDRPVELELTTWNQSRSADRVDADAGMSRWALEYLSAQRDFAERLGLLNELRERDVRESVDAEVLVTEAVRGSPAQARAAAREALLVQRPSAVLTLAMLEVAPRMPRTPQNSELVSALTASPSIPVDDPQWALRVRRVLVQTALEQLAAEGEDGLVDRLAAVLGESYAARAVGEPSGTGSAAVPRLAAAEAAAMLRIQWERQARQGGLGSGAVGVEGALSRHAARRGLAQGPVQTFAAEQLAAFELMAIAVAAERIERASDVQALQGALREQRREAGDVISQILAVERAFVDLWAIRLGQEGS